MELYIIAYTFIWLVIIWLFTLPLKILAMNYKLIKWSLRLKNIWWKKHF